MIEVDGEEAAELVDDGVVTVVDVIPDSDFGGHIEGSLAITVEELPRWLEYLKRRRPVLVVCPGGGASSNAAKMIEFYDGVDGSDVYHLRGGLKRWPGDLAGADGMETPE